MGKKLLLIFLVGVIIGVGVYFLFFSKEEVKVDTYEEVVQKFDNKEDFILVIGTSTCGTCKEYKSTILKEFVNKYSQDEVVLLYKDTTMSFANNSEYREFLDKYGLKELVDILPTTFIISNGEIVNQKDIINSLEELEKLYKDGKNEN